MKDKDLVQLTVICDLCHKEIDYKVDGFLGLMWIKPCKCAKSHSKKTKNVKERKCPKR